MPPAPIGATILYGPRRSPGVSGMGSGSMFLHRRRGPTPSAHLADASLPVGMAAGAHPAGADRRDDLVRSDARSGSDAGPVHGCTSLTDCVSVVESSAPA